jgi:hypothetical protein
VEFVLMSADPFGEKNFFRNETLHDSSLVSFYLFELLKAT